MAYAGWGEGKGKMKINNKTYARRAGAFLCLMFLNAALYAENFRVFVKDRIEVSADVPDGASVPMIFSDSVLIFLSKDTRFVSGLEFELTAPPAWLSFPESIALGIYSNLNNVPDNGFADIECTPLLFEPAPSKIHSVYQLPIRERHNLRGTPYASIINTLVLPENLPLLFRLMPIAKGWNDEIAAFRFQLKVKPVFSDEGTLIINIHRPEIRPNGAYIVMIDEHVVENPAAERFIKEGEHNLTVTSSDYRSENRRLIIERGRTYNISITLRDLTPLIVFEAPEQARLFLDGVLVKRTAAPLAIEPGPHEIRALISDYTIIKNVMIENGKTYRAVFSVDMLIYED
jgi:hypothetical protein